MSPKQNKVGPFPTPYSIKIIAKTNVYYLGTHFNYPK